MGKAAKGGKKLPSAPLADKKKKAKKNPLFEKATGLGMASTLHESCTPFWGTPLFDVLPLFSLDSLFVP